MASLPLRESAAEASAWSQANENNEVVGHDRGPDIGLEVVEPAPGAAGQAVGPLEAGDAGLDPGAEVAQLAIDPAAADHVCGPCLRCWGRTSCESPCPPPRTPSRDPGSCGWQNRRPPPPDAAPRRMRRCG